MRKILVFLVVLGCFFTVSCSKGSQINGHSMKTAYRSVRGLKKRLPAEEVIAFEISFWSMRDVYRDNGEFLDQVDGKTPQEIIAIGKKIFQERKAAGVADYVKHASWEDMISKFAKEKMDQAFKAKKKTRDSKEDHSVIYKL